MGPASVVRWAVEAGGMMWVVAGLGVGASLNLLRLWEFLRGCSCYICRPWLGLSSVEWGRGSEGSGWPFNRGLRGSKNALTLLCRCFSWVCTQVVIPQG